MHICMEITLVYIKLVKCAKDYLLVCTIYEQILHSLVFVLFFVCTKHAKIASLKSLEVSLPLALQSR